MADQDKLRKLAAWYREFAERAGSPTIWDSRLRMAEDLEAEAGQRGHRGMESAEELRAEARRLIETVNNLSDPELKKELAARALELSERAEAIENSMEDPEIIRMNISRYRSILSAGVSDAGQKKIVEEMLADAEAMLTNFSKKAP
jgi:SMC interacting uncharacterized protein involved in chromosome segregation